MAYFSGQGRVYIGARDSAGNPAGLTFVGNVPELKVSLSVETLEHQEAQSGQRLTDLQLIKTKKGEFACTLEELSSGNLALALYGHSTTVAPGTVTGEALPNPVTAGSLYQPVEIRPGEAPDSVGSADFSLLKRSASASRALKQARFRTSRRTFPAGAAITRPPRRSASAGGRGCSPPSPAETAPRPS